MKKPILSCIPAQQLSLMDSWDAEVLHPSLPARLYRQWLSADTADKLWQSALALPWQPERIKCQGVWRTLTRKVVWLGDELATYRYTGRVHTPVPWTSALQALRVRLTAELSVPFNSVLGNYYADGQQSMGYHHDNEPELGEQPCIASISLGAERPFRFRHITTGKTISLILPHGSLLVMHDTCQRDWQHALPPVKNVTARVNFTFRNVLG